MGCGASSGGAAGGAAVAPETATATPVAERSRLTSLRGNFDLAREVVVMATWTVRRAPPLLLQRPPAAQQRNV